MIINRANGPQHLSLNVYEVDHNNVNPLIPSQNFSGTVPMIAPLQSSQICPGLSKFSPHLYSGQGYHGGECKTPPSPDRGFFNRQSEEFQALPAPLASCGISLTVPSRWRVQTSDRTTRIPSSCPKRSRFFSMPYYRALFYPQLQGSEYSPGSDPSLAFDRKFASPSYRRQVSAPKLGPFIEASVHFKEIQRPEGGIPSPSSLRSSEQSGLEGSDLIDRNGSQKAMLRQSRRESETWLMNCCLAYRTAHQKVDENFNDFYRTQRVIQADNQCALTEAPRQSLHSIALQCQRAPMLKKSITDRYPLQLSDITFSDLDYSHVHDPHLSCSHVNALNAYLGIRAFKPEMLLHQVSLETQREIGQNPYWFTGEIQSSGKLLIAYLQGRVRGMDPKLNTGMHQCVKESLVQCQEWLDVCQYKSDGFLRTSPPLVQAQALLASIHDAKVDRLILARCHMGNWYFVACRAQREQGPNDFLILDACLEKPFRCDLSKLLSNLTVEQERTHDIGYRLILPTAPLIRSGHTVRPEKVHLTSLVQYEQTDIDEKYRKILPVQTSAPTSIIHCLSWDWPLQGGNAPKGSS